ncbi:hypothetical protein EDD15DRAFT_447372 [Pisolithus albus]|nr:hypothetical protein EDD15DRAFT_447372 [Pisolithus albus]
MDAWPGNLLLLAFSALFVLLLSSKVIGIDGQIRHVTSQTRTEGHQPCCTADGEIIAKMKSTLPSKTPTSGNYRLTNQSDGIMVTVITPCRSLTLRWTKPEDMSWGLGLDLLPMPRPSVPSAVHDTHTGLSQLKDVRMS